MICNGVAEGQREIRSVDKISIATHDQNRQRSMKRAMVKSRWIAVVIVCAYLVFWLPYYIAMLVFFLSPGPEEVGCLEPMVASSILGYGRYGARFCEPIQINFTFQRTEPCTRQKNLLCYFILLEKIIET